MEQVEGAAVEGGGGDDVVAGLADRQDRKCLGSLTGGDGEGAGNTDGGFGAALRADIRASKTPWVGFMIRV